MSEPSDNHIALICMPWHGLSSPSLGVAVLQSALRRCGYRCTSHSLFLDFMAFVSSERIPARIRLRIEDYFAVSDVWFFDAPGEWVFAAALREPDARLDRDYCSSLRRKGMPHRLIRRLAELRAYVPAFLEECATRILADRAPVVGFTTTFGQVVASLALARVIRRRAPAVKIVFGGANCEGAMGAALLRGYPDLVDVVVRGEGDVALPELVEALVAGDAIPDLPGICSHAPPSRDDEAAAPARCIPEAVTAVAMDDVPPPDYTDYFSRLEELALQTAIVPVLPYESSRGCWWGARSHCTFCGLNGRLMAHRSKAPDRVLAELVTLADRHRALDFTMVDNIIALEYFDSLLPRLRDSGFHLKLFYQTKSNLSRDQVGRLRDAGVYAIRPGIESLSTPILRLMRKGVTGIQNLQLLKWCAEIGVHAAWSVIYGLPGEPAAEYERMAAVAPLLMHLAPPSLARLTLDRFSPYWQDPAAHGLRIRGAPAHFAALHDLSPELRSELTWTFDYELVEGRDPEGYVTPLRRQIEIWRREVHQNRGALSYRRGPNFVTIDDRRTMRQDGPRRYVLEDLEAQVYCACDAVATPQHIATRIGGADLERI
ncbi:MAG: RiPP maturation radical SAM C-methyltransferase, partial [Planctomycetes bacterium]|nr:RiPP maturation radical SAM C-methyltransferase [Planctomycetota bacterium]